MGRIGVASLVLMAAMLSCRTPDQVGEDVRDSLIARFGPKGGEEATPKRIRELFQKMLHATTEREFAAVKVGDPYVFEFVFGTRAYGPEYEEFERRIVAARLPMSLAKEIWEERSFLAHRFLRLEGFNEAIVQVFHENIKALNLASVFREGAHPMFKKLVAGLPVALDIEGKKRVVSALLDVEPGDTRTALVKFFEFAGPGTQKIMQLMAAQVEDKDLEPRLRSLRSRLPPLSDEYVDEVLAGLEVDGWSTLGAGSVAQAIRMKVKFEGEWIEAVGKIRRPAILSALKRDRDRCVEMIPDNPNLLATVFEPMIREADFRLEHKNIGIMAPVYAGYGRGIREIKAIGEPRRNLIIMSKAPGLPLDEVGDPSKIDHKDLKAMEEGLAALKVREKLARHYFYAFMHRAVIGDGRFHGDPHAGNAMVDLASETITPIDFGSVGHFTKVQQRAALLLAIGFLAKEKAMLDFGVRAFVADALSGDAETLAEFYRDYDVFRKEYDQILSRSRPEEAFLEVVVLQDFPIPQELQLFLRGSSMLRHEFEEQEDAGKIYARVLGRPHGLTGIGEKARNKLLYEAGARPAALRAVFDYSIDSPWQATKFAVKHAPAALKLAYKNATLSNAAWVAKQGGKAIVNAGKKVLSALRALLPW